MIAARPRVTFLWFNSKTYCSTIVYLRCFTWSAKIIGEFVHILKRYHNH
jgi:hypothetical protein